MYYINEGMKNIRRHKGIFFGSVSIIAVCLALLGSAVLIIANLNYNLSHIISENEFIAYAVSDWDVADAEKLTDKLLSVDNVASVTYISPEDAMENFQSRMVTTSEYYLRLPSDLLPARFTVSVSNIDLLQQTSDAVEKLDEIDHNTLALGLARVLSTTQKTFTAMAVFLLAALLMISLFIISNTVRLAMKGREEEIAVMKIVGATNHFIRAPYLVEGLGLGALSGIFGFVFIFIFYSIIQRIFLIYHFTELFNILRFSTIWHFILPVCVLSSVLIGVFGTLLSLRKLLEV